MHWASQHHRTRASYRWTEEDGCNNNDIGLLTGARQHKQAIDMIGRPKNTTFVTCIEAGLLEKQVVLLARSLRALDSNLSSSDLLAIQPRRDVTLASETRRELARLGVEVVTEDLAGRYSWNPHFNKAAAMCWAEAHVDSTFVTWLDGDIIFLREPLGLIPADKISFLARAGEIDQGTDGQDINMPYWARLSQILEVPYEDADLIDSVPPAKKIYEYYQSGVYTIRLGEGISERHFNNFKRLIESRVASRTCGIYHHDQVSLAMAVRSTRGERRVYPWEMNYNINIRQIENIDIEMLKKTKILHYHDSFLPGAYNSMKRFLAHIPEEPRRLVEECAPFTVTLPAIRRLRRKILRSGDLRKLKNHEVGCSVY